MHCTREAMTRVRTSERPDGVLMLQARQRVGYVDLCGFVGFSYFLGGFLTYLSL